MKIPKVVRTTILWTHLVTALITGLVIFVMSVTGVLIAYERQMLEWAAGFKVAPPTVGAERLPMEKLLADFRAQRPDAELSNITVTANPNKPVAFRAGRSTIYVDPYTGAVLGEGSKKMQGFVASVRSWHRWLAITGDSRPIGKAITGASNLAFLFIVVSGFYLWWPKRWTWKKVKPVVIPTTKLRGKPRDFNWHNSFGFWAAVPLFFVVLSGVFISYSWPRQFVDKWLGGPPQAEERGEGGRAREGQSAARGPREGGAERAERAGGSRGEGVVGESGAERGSRPRREGAGEGGVAREGRPGSGVRGEQSPARRQASPNEGRPGGPGAKPPIELPSGQLNTLVADAERRASGWRSLSFRLPSEGDKDITFAINRSDNPRPDTREQLKLSLATGHVAGLTTYSDGPLSRRLTSWTRYLHTGEVFGVVGQTIAMLVSLIGALLVWTGFTLTWRRFRAWRKRKSRTGQLEQAQTVEVPEAEREPVMV